MTNHGTMTAAASESVVSTQAQHTPGPWHVSVGEIVGHVEVGVDDAKDNFICTMHAIPPTSNMANALLIAAAPELLDALKRVVALYDSLDLTEEMRKAGWRNLDQPWVIAARAAIAKAEGRA